MRSVSLYIALLLLLVAARNSAAGESEYQLKAAMLYNFAKFVEWPADSFGNDNRITFCIAGKSPLDAPIQQMQGKPVKDRMVSIRQLAHPNDLAGCQMLFIPQSEYPRLSLYLEQAEHYPVVTVSDLDRFVASGGIIGFYEEGSKLRFEINLAAAQKQRLKFSSYLLNLTRRVR